MQIQISLRIINDILYYEDDTLFEKNPLKLHKFFSTKYHGPLVIFRIKDYDDLPNRI